jgi:hypothetical protein
MENLTAMGRSPVDASGVGVISGASTKIGKRLGDVSYHLMQGIVTSLVRRSWKEDRSLNRSGILKSYENTNSQFLSQFPSQLLNRLWAVCLRDVVGEKATR